METSLKIYVTIYYQFRVTWLNFLLVSSTIKFNPFETLYQFKAMQIKLLDVDTGDTTIWTLLNV